MQTLPSTGQLWNFWLNYEKATISMKTMQCVLIVAVDQVVKTAFPVGSRSAYSLKTGKGSPDTDGKEVYLYPVDSEFPQVVASKWRKQNSSGDSTCCYKGPPRSRRPLDWPLESWWLICPWG